MKILLGFLWSVGAMAAGPTDLGDFKGLLFTGPSMSQNVTIQGGSLTECKLNSSSLSTIYKCNVDAKISVSTGAGNETYSFQGASVLVPAGQTSRHHYYRGSRIIEIAGNQITQPVRVTLNLDTTEPDRVSGYLELTDSGVRSWFDAYR